MELFLGSVERSTLLSSFYWVSIKFSSYDAILHTWEVFCSTSFDENDWVLLDSVLFSRNICPYLLTVWKSYSCYFSLSWVWFLWSHNSDFETYSSLERRRVVVSLVVLESVGRVVKSRRSRSILFACSWSFDKLLNSWHMIQKILEAKVRVYLWDSSWLRRYVFRTMELVYTKRGIFSRIYDTIMHRGCGICLECIRIHHFQYFHFLKIKWDAEIAEE